MRMGRTGMADRFDFTLGSVEASVVGRALGVDVRRFPLRIRNTTIDLDRFAKLAMLVAEQLESRGLSTSGTLHPSVRTALTLFSGNQVTISITGLDDTGEDIAMLAMTDGAQALRVTQPAGEDSIHFSLFADEDLVEQLSGALPMAPAARTRTLCVEHREGPARSATARRRQARAEAERKETDAFDNIEVVAKVDVPPSSPGPRTDLELLREILAGERSGGGFMAATGRGRHGELRSASPVGWVDTSQGRYLVETTQAEGVTTARYVPAGHAEVAKAVQHLISSVY